MTSQVETHSQLQQLAYALFRRRYMILAMAATGGALALLAAYQIPAKYTAKAQIVLDTPNSGPIGSGSSKSTELSELTIETHVTILASRSHLQQVRESLLAGPERPEELSPSAHLKSLAAVGAALAESSMSDMSGTTGLLSVDELERCQRSYQERGSRVIATTCTSTDPIQAAALANQIARQYVNRQDDRTKADERLSLAQQQLSDLNRQLSTARSELAERQARLASVRNLRGQGTVTDALIDALGSPVLTELHRAQLTLLKAKTGTGSASAGSDSRAQSTAAGLKDLRLKIDSEIDRAVRSLENETQLTGARVQSLQQRLNSMLTSLREPQGAATPIGGAGSRAVPSATYFENLLKRQKAEMRTQTESPSGVRILTVADAPIWPSSPSPLLFVFPAIFAATFIGGLLATILEGLDRTLRGERQVKLALGIDSVGLVPRKNGLRKLRRHELVLQKPFAVYSEAIRSVVTETLRLTKPNVPPKVVLVTSSLAEEGKTDIAVGFAVYAASLDRRVLLVDLSVRNPAVTSRLGIEPALGVVDVLLGRPLDDVIHRMPELGIDVLPSTRVAADPVALLSSHSMRNLMQQLRERYDLIVVDGTHMLGAPEARLLGPMADKILFVVKWGSTKLEMAQRALDLLRSSEPAERVNGDYISAVITQVHLKKHVDYRYGDSVEALAQK